MWLTLRALPSLLTQSVFTDLPAAHLSLSEPLKAETMSNVAGKYAPVQKEVTQYSQDYQVLEEREDIEWTWQFGDIVEKGHCGN